MIKLFTYSTCYNQKYKVNHSNYTLLNKIQNESRDQSGIIKHAVEYFKTLQKYIRFSD